MARLLEGKVAIITGAASGIGRSAAMLFAREGSMVAVVDTAVDGGEETVQEIRKLGGEAFFVKTDVTNEDEVRAMIERTVSTFERLDCAFNNAGITTHTTSFEKFSNEIWTRIVDVDLKGVWLCMKYELATMREQGHGSIVNTSSYLGLVGSRGSNPAYHAAKHGVIGLTRSAAVQYAKAGIRVNAVCPGATETPQISELLEADPNLRAAMTNISPMGRLGKPEEVAQAAAWLLSDRSSFVTGQALAVDGGAVAQ